MLNLDRILIYQVFWDMKQVLCIVLLLKIKYAINISLEIFLLSSPHTRIFSLL